MKSWKHWPYWLKGGVIGGGIVLVFAILATLCEYVVMLPPNVEPMRLTFCLPFAVLLFPFVPLMYTVLGEWFFSAGARFEMWVFLLTGVIFYFLLGSLIGALFSYIKSKNKNVQ